MYIFFSHIVQGTGDEVPKYLRYEGKVRNRRVGKRDCLVYIHDIWRKKGVHDAQVCHHTAINKRRTVTDVFDNLYIDLLLGVIGCVDKMWLRITIRFLFRIS